MHGIVVVKTELVEPGSTENWVSESVLFWSCLLESPSLPSNIVKEGSAWDDCECPGKRETNKTNIVLVYNISWIMVGLLADKTLKNPKSQT